MADVALTVIGLGHDVNGKYERVDVQPGESLPSWVSKEEVAHLKEIGAIGVPIPTTAEAAQNAIDAAVAKRDAEIEKLKQQLAEAFKAQTK